MSLINFEESLIFTWSENCVLTDITIQAARNANPNADSPVEARERIDAPTNATFKITDTKLYVPVVTLSTQDDNKFLEELKSGLKRTIKSNKCRSEMIDSTFLKSIDYSSHHLKMKKTEHLFPIIMHQKLK